MAKIVLIGALPESLTIFRGDLIRSLVGAGHEVTAMATPAENAQIEHIEALGARFRSYPVRRSGLNPLTDIVTLFALRKAFRELDPDVVLAYTIKPIIWSGIAIGRLSKTRFFALVTGLGFAFQGRTLFHRILRSVATFLYRTALRRAEAVIFQNIDNQKTFIELEIVSQSKTYVVNGSGVDTNRFARVAFSPGPPTFLLIARLLSEKGLREYAAAARLLKERHPEAICQLVGPLDPSPDGITLEEITDWQTRGDIRYLGDTRDVRPYIAGCDIYVLPSYHEGMPRTVLEAMAMGRPILTTDVPGCRETVEPGTNGYLVPKGDANALAERMSWFIEHADQWESMGQASRRMAEQRFDVRRINQEMMRIIFSR